MATTNSDLFASETIAPLTAQGGRWFDWQIDDQAGLADADDIIKLVKLPFDIVVLDARLHLGQFDTDGTPTVTHSLVLNNGTEYEIIKDVALGQTGEGLARCGESGDEIAGAIGVPITAAMVEAGAYVGLKQTAALATAATSDRKIAFGIYCAVAAERRTT